MTHKNTFFKPNKTLNCKGKLLDLSKPQVMGILNLTPDSFYDGGKYQNEASVLKEVEGMLDAGAAIIDVGGMSSRPGASIIDEVEELRRVLPIVELICSRFPSAIVSVDTVRSGVAKAVVEAGASMINDISAGKVDAQMYETVGALNVPYVLMHMQGLPAHMQDQPQYDQVVLEVIDFLQKELALLKTAGVKDVILDPGFGFGKSLRQNYDLLAQLTDFRIFDLPILVGVSRKSMIYKLLGTKPEGALNGSTVLHTMALLNGASILRVHDVKEAKEVVEIVNFVESA